MDNLPVSLPLLDQIVTVGTAFILKPLYQIVALLMVVMLWKRKEPDLTAVKMSMLAFVVGENGCAANYLFFRDGSFFLECIHTSGMLVSFGFIVHALMTTVDRRIVHFSSREKRCALLSICHRCSKYGDFPCNGRTLFLAMVAAAWALAWLPLTASLGVYPYQATVFGRPVVFTHPLLYQLVEVRIYPLLALFFLALSFAVVLRRKEEGFGPGTVLFAMGMGPLAFSLMRFLLYWGFRESPLWANAWEEITEFLFIALLFWITFKVWTGARSREFRDQGVGTRRKQAPPGTPDPTFSG